ILISRIAEWPARNRTILSRQPRRKVVMEAIVIAQDANCIVRTGISDENVPGRDIAVNESRAFEAGDCRRELAGEPNTLLLVECRPAAVRSKATEVLRASIVRSPDHSCEMRDDLDPIYVDAAKPSERNAVKEIALPRQFHRDKQPRSLFPLFHFRLEDFQERRNVLKSAHALDLEVGPQTIGLDAAARPSRRLLRYAYGRIRPVAGFQMQGVTVNLLELACCDGIGHGFSSTGPGCCSGLVWTTPLISTSCVGGLRMIVV